MTTQGVYNLSLVFAELEESDLLYEFAGIATEKINRLKKAELEEESPLLTAAAAGEAYYLYVLKVFDGDSVKIGDLTVKGNVAAVENAKKLRDSLYSAAKGLIEDEDFLFKSE